MLQKMIGLALLTGLALLPAAPARATDSLLPGKRLMIVNVPGKPQHSRILVSARDASLAISAPGSSGDPTCSGAGGGGGSITFASPTSGASFTAPLPCQSWTGRKTGSWRYRDVGLQNGPCSVVQVRSTRTLHAICLGKGATPLDYVLESGQPQAPVNVRLELGAGPDRYCMSFGGTVKFDGSNGSKFFAANSSAPSACD